VVYAVLLNATRLLISGAFPSTYCISEEISIFPCMLEGAVALRKFFETVLLILLLRNRSSRYSCCTGYYTVKKVSGFPVPSWDVTHQTANLFYSVGTCCRPYSPLTSSGWTGRYGLSSFFEMAGAPHSLLTPCVCMGMGINFHLWTL